MEGYHWFGRNRRGLHRKAVRRSGGVGGNDKQGSAGGRVVGAVHLVLVEWNGPISLEE